MIFAGHFFHYFSPENEHDPPAVALEYLMPVTIFFVVSGYTLTVLYLGDGGAKFSRPGSLYVFLPSSLNSYEAQTRNKNAMSPSKARIQSNIWSSDKAAGRERILCESSSKVSRKTTRKKENDARPRLGMHDKGGTS